MSFALTSSSAIDDAFAGAEEQRRRSTSNSPKSARSRPSVSQAFVFPEARFLVDLWFDGHTPQGAEHLVSQAYSSLGYRSDLGGSPHPGRTATLQATQNDHTCGTMTINFDGPDGLQADILYPEELAELRRRGSVCEFTRLALDRNVSGREVLCALFYMAYAFAHHVREVDHLVIEVNPRHEAFYRRMLGFRNGGDKRLCPRVNAPAVLMHLDFAHTREQIAQARQSERHTYAALYRFALSVQEESSLIRRMRIHACN
jgi:hypothetical protein